MSNPYSYQTFAQLKTSLSQRLSDLSKVFWTDAELGIYLNAALREFNFISRLFRDKGTFETSASGIFYDLAVVLENGDGEAFLAYTVTDASLLKQAKFMLMEPNPTDNTTFTDAFTLADFNDAFTRRKNQFLLETGAAVSLPASQVVTPATQGRVVVASDSVIDVVRAHWTDQAGNVTTLFREDGFAGQSFQPNYPQEYRTPRRFAVYPDPLLTLQLLPPPLDSGTLTLQTISAGGVPDDATLAILWGVLGDLLNKPGNARDPQRAEYCMQRWGEGIIIGKQMVTVMQSFVDNAPVSTSSVFNNDAFAPHWINTRGLPKVVGILGDVAAPAPAANGIYSITMDCARNALQLVNDADQLPLGREYLDLVLGYASHLAMFKQGGEEFRQSFQLYDQFIKAAVGYNNRMNARSLNFETLVDRALVQDVQQPLRTEEAAA